MHTLPHGTPHPFKAFDDDEEVGGVRKRTNEEEARMGCRRDTRSASQGNGDDNGSEQATIHERPFEEAQRARGKYS